MKFHEFKQNKKCYDDTCDQHTDGDGCNLCIYPSLLKCFMKSRPEPQLKKGDIIDVRDNDNQEWRVNMEFVSYCKEAVLCCSPSGLLSYATWKQWRISEPESLKWEDRSKLYGKYVVKKDDNESDYLITRIFLHRNIPRVVIFGYGRVTFEDLCEDWTFADGTPIKYGNY